LQLSLKSFKEVLSSYLQITKNAGGQVTMSVNQESVKRNQSLIKKLRTLRKEPDESKALALLERLSLGFELVNPFAAGIDIASGEHWVCVPSNDENDSIRRFGAYTVHLYEIRDWLIRHGVTTVAMESTGVYWIPLYDLLEESGIEACLVNARELKSVCGRPKTDRLDCQWIQRLHTYGLLKQSFRPDREACALRSIWRNRSSIVREVNRTIQRMQKSLHEMNVLLTKVVTDVTGKTGMSIMRAIAAGETDPTKLAGHRHHRVKKGFDEFVEALRGTYRSEHVFLLKSELAHYDFLLKQEMKLDEEIERRLEPMSTKCTLNDETRAANRKAAVAYRKNYKNAPCFDARTRLHETLGVDVCQIPGIGATNALGIVMEIGVDMTRWPDESHFSSWLGLSPNPNVSAGKNLGTHTKKNSNAAAYQFRMAARTLRCNNGHLGSFYRRMAARHGPPHAITATAHKLAVIFYHMVKRGEQYKDIDRSEYERIIEEQKVANMQKRALKEGFELVPITAKAKEHMESINGKVEKAG
jgi:transposase